MRQTPYAHLLLSWAATTPALASDVSRMLKDMFTEDERAFFYQRVEGAPFWSEFEHIYFLAGKLEQLRSGRDSGRSICSTAAT